MLDNCLQQPELTPPPCTRVGVSCALNRGAGIERQCFFDPKAQNPDIWINLCSFIASMALPPSVARVEKEIEAMMQDVQRQHLIPKQKEAFLCCAKCCDNQPDDMRQLQGW